MKSLPIITNSRIKDARNCLRLHHYRYTLGYEPIKKASALGFGTLVHKLLEAWWKEPNPTLRLTAVLDAIPPESDPYDFARAFEMMRGYDEYWRAEQHEVIDVERQFGLYFDGHWTLGGKIDAIVRDNAGYTYIVEHKTTSENVTPGSDYWSLLRMDSQISTYWHAAEQLGIQIDGCLYDVLVKPGLRPLEVNSRRTEPESPVAYADRLRAEIDGHRSEYYHRRVITRLQDEVQDNLDDMHQWATIIRRIENDGILPPPRNPDACINKYRRRCDYFAVCTGETALENQDLFYKKENLHPELELTDVPR
jgi:hypothetical protein